MRAKWAAPIAIVAAMVALGAGAAPASADVDDFTFESMDADYTLTRADDGTSRLAVSETFVAVFPEFDQNHGIRRLLPDSYLGAPLMPSLVSITDAAGNPRAAEEEYGDGVLAITSRSDDYVHGAQSYVFSYTMSNVVRAFADTRADEFYWNVNGLDWAQPFGRVSATLHVAGELASALTGNQACYVGEAGSTTPCTIEVISETDDEVVIRASASDVPPFQTMTIAVGFQPGTFTPFNTAWLSTPFGWFQALFGVLAVAALIWAIIVRRRHLRHAPGRPTIIAEYEPPAHIDALEGAVLLGKSTKAIPAEVLEQAVVGSIRIVEGEKRWFGGTKLTAQLVDSSRADGDGILLLQGLFPDLTPGAEYTFGSSDTRLSAAARSILKAADAELTARGLRRTVPVTVRLGPILLAVFAATGSLIFGVLALGAYTGPEISVGVLIGGILIAVAVIGILVHRPLSATGSEVRDHLLGLQMFIAWAEADRIRMLQSPEGAERRPIDIDDPRQKLHLYEALLPYAVVFGLEEQWARELAVLYDQTATPSWYFGVSGFNAAAFSSGISSLSTASSSSTGGSTGGGSAGGGGGGGGGGGV